MNEKEAIQKGVEILFTPEPLSLSEWADENFYLSPESSSIEGKWECLPYQIGPLNWMGNDNIKIIDIMKSARVGYTKWLVAATGYFLEHKKRNGIIYQPTDSDAEDFVKDEIDCMFRDVPVVRKILKCNPESKSQFNTMAKKACFGATLDIKGGKSPRNYRRMTKDFAIYDELSAFDPDVGGSKEGEGRPNVIGDVRIATSSFPKSIRGSTPKIKGTCLIEETIANAEMTMFRFVKCPYCDGPQKFEWWSKRFEYDDNDPSTIRYRCVHCGFAITYDKYPDMDKGGRWQTDDGIYYDEESDMFFDADNSVVPDPKHIGVKIWAAYSYFFTWEDLAYEWIQAVSDQKIGKTTRLKSFINTFLGETWEETGERINQEWGERVESYTPDSLPKDIVCVTAGVDVQGGKNARLELEFVGWGVGEESWSIDYASISGDPELDEVWMRLDDELKQVFVREDGIRLCVSAVCIDAGFLPGRVFRFTGPRKQRRIYSTKGKAQHTGPLTGKPSWQGEKGHKALQYAINTDEAKTILFTRISNVAEPGPGFCHFPDHYVDAYFDMLAAEEKRFIKNKNGTKKVQWVKTKERNEAIDCRVEAMAALQIVNPNLSALKLRLNQEADNIKNNVTVEPRVPKRRVRSKGID